MTIPLIHLMVSLSDGQRHKAKVKASYVPHVRRLFLADYGILASTLLMTIMRLKLGDRCQERMSMKQHMAAEGFTLKVRTRSIYGT